MWTDFAFRNNEMRIPRAGTKSVLFFVGGPPRRSPPLRVSHDGVPAEFSEGRRRDISEGPGRAVAGSLRGERREALAVDPADVSGERVLLSRAPLR